MTKQGEFDRLSQQVEKVGMRQRVVHFVTFGATWTIGCIVFDMLLKLDGSWLMWAGFVTGFISKAVADCVAE